jgi:hypothetical protein
LPDIANIMVDVISQDAVIAFVDFNDATGSSGTQTIRLLPISEDLRLLSLDPAQFIGANVPEYRGHSL